MIRIHYYLDTRAIAKDGSAPLKFDFCCKGKHTTMSAGLRLLPSEWDATRQKVVGRADELTINMNLLQLMSRVTGIVMQLASSGELAGLATITQVKNRVAAELWPQADAGKLFLHRFRLYASRCRSAHTRELYNNTVKRICQHAPKAESLSFEMVTKDWLCGFEAWLASSGHCPSVNGRSAHLRNIRAVFNDAIDNEITSFYPFRRFKIKTERTAKRAVPVELLRELFAYGGLTWQQQYVDAFKLMFCLIGINVVDLLALKREDMAGGRIGYRRAKTGRMYDIKVEPEALGLIEQYSGKQGRLLCWGEGRKNYTSFTYQMDKGLKAVGTTSREWKKDDHGRFREVLVYHPAFPMLTSYVARHSWATIAASLDIPKETIAHALGHGGNTVTDIYIDFDQRKVDEANRRVIDWVLYGKR